MSLCEPLTRLNPDYSVSDGLASLAQPDDLTMVYTIKPGVTFWDGTALTAEDVVWSLDHARDPATITSFLFANVASVTATGPLEVTLKLSAPDTMVPIELATFAGAVQQKEFSEKAGKDLGTPKVGVMCSGPLKFDSWTAGQSITLLANTSYWDPARAAKTKKVELSFTADSSTLAQALSSGELDGAYEVPAAIIPKLRELDGRNPGHRRADTAQPPARGAEHQGGALLADIRKAFYMSIDSAGIAKVVYHGAAVANYTCLNKDSWNNATIPTREGDLAVRLRRLRRRAQRVGNGRRDRRGQDLAAGAGYKGDKVVIGILAGDATLYQVSQLVQAEAKAAGLNVEIKQLQPIDYSNAFVDPKARKGLDMIFAVSFNGAPNPFEPMIFNFLPDSFYNYTGYNDPTVTANITDARKTLDPVKQATLLVEAQDDLREGVPGDGPRADRRAAVPQEAARRGHGVLRLPQLPGAGHHRLASDPCTDRSERSSHGLHRRAVGEPGARSSRPGSPGGSSSRSSRFSPRASCCTWR